MRLQGYIGERRSKEIDPFDAITAMHKNCKQAVSAYLKGHRVYRGLNQAKSALEIEPKKHTRKSANTNNLYTLIMDNSPAWNKYPKRSQSIICSSSLKGATPYGNPYAIFPVDGTSYGVCPVNDIWGSFDKTIDGPMMGFNYSVLESIAEREMHIVGASEVNSISGLKSVMKQMDESWANILDEDKKASIVRINAWMDGYKGDFFKLMNELIEPNQNGFKAINNPMGIPNEKKQHEIWTDGKSYMISEIWLRNNESMLVSP